MNNNLKNFFLGKNYRTTTRSESSSLRLYILTLCLIQFGIISITNIQPESIASMFFKVANVAIILGIAIFTTSILNKFFDNLLKIFFYVIATFLYISNVVLLVYTGFNNSEAIFLNLVIMIFLILPLRNIQSVKNTLFVYLGIIFIGFLYTEQPAILNAVFYTAACLLLYLVQSRQIDQKKYLDTVQNYLISIANSGKDFYFLIDDRLQIKASNSFAISFWGEGYINDLTGKTIINYIAKDYRSTFINDIERVINKNVEVEKEILLSDSDGKTFWVISNLSPIKISGQTFISFVAKNISEIKETESHLRDALDNLAEKKGDMELNQKAMINMLEDIEIQKRIAKKKEEETATILENIADAVIVLDEMQRIIIINKAAIKLTKYSAEELLKSLYTDKIKIFEEKKDIPFTEYLEKTYKGEVVVSENKYYILTKDNEKISISISSAPSISKNNKVDKCIIVIKDVTRTRQLEKMKDEFVSIASHQLRTPLTTIKWHTEIMDDFKKDLPEDLKTSVNFISEASERLIHLVSELLDVSRIDTGRNFTIEKTDNDLVTIINKIMTSVKMLAENNNVNVKFEYNKRKKYIVSVDEFKITEAVGNIINNAIKYSKENTEVSIKLTDEDKFVAIEVEDHGLGIPKEEQSRIFERFYRAKNAMTHEGTGLGLYITKSIIEGHGGELTFKSKEGVGTTFIIKLPIK